MFPLRFYIMKSSIVSFGVILLISCNHTPSSIKGLSLRDSVVKQHLSIVDSLEYYDTLNEDYKMLKAYINDDTGYFLQKQRDQKLFEEERSKNLPLDTCIHLQKLSDLTVDEAYRFSHSESFCFYGQRITITRKKDTVKIHYIEYSLSPDGKVIELTRNGEKTVIGPGCSVVKEFERELSMKDWEGLKEKLCNANYWGLKPNYYSLHTDGSFWQIEASKRNKWTSKIEQTNSVSRHCPCSPSFEELGAYFLTLSGEKTMCEDFY